MLMLDLELLFSKCYKVPHAGKDKSSVTYKYNQRFSLTLFVSTNKLKCLDLFRIVLSKFKTNLSTMAFSTTKGAYLILLLMLLENIYVNGFRGRTFTDGEWEQLKIHNKPYVKSFKVLL